MIYKIKDMLNNEILYECNDMRTAEIMADSFEKDEGLSVEIFIEHKDRDDRVERKK